MIATSRWCTPSCNRKLYHQKQCWQSRVHCCRLQTEPLAHSTLHYLSAMRRVECVPCLPCKKRLLLLLACAGGFGVGRAACLCSENLQCEMLPCA